MACFDLTVVLKISSYEFENAAMKGVKTHLSIGKICIMKPDLKLLRLDLWQM